MSNESVAKNLFELKLALQGGRGQMDGWLEMNTEAEVVAAINALMLEVKESSDQQKTKDFRRMHISQEDSNHPLYSMSGANVLARQEDESLWRVYFVTGAIVSMTVERAQLSEGWV